MKRLPPAGDEFPVTVYSSLTEQGFGAKEKGFLHSMEEFAFYWVLSKISRAPMLKPFTVEYFILPS